jgi:metal-sulfur cluster biosynthetic enzyme
MGDRDEKVWDRLRSMKDPALRRDIVSLGLVRDLQVAGGTVTVHLESTGGDAYRNEALAAAIRRELDTLDGIERVVVSGGASAAGRPADGSPEAGALHLPVLDNAGPDPSLAPAGLAPEAGYGLAGPEPLPSPEAEIPNERYAGWPPVYQWEIDPNDPAPDSGEAQVRLADWEYDIWWQVHPAGLVYASIQALQDDAMTGGPQREHPMGRNVVVNVVYDRKRRAVVAVYGTARDFRPFIEAFRIGCGLDDRAQETNA